MGRILKLLTNALDQSKGEALPISSTTPHSADTFHESEAGMLHLGDTAELSPNASAMLRIATLSAWAQLDVASNEQSYLKEIVAPHRATLSSLWISILRDYASVRADAEVANDSSAVALDSSYSSLGKEVLLPVGPSEAYWGTLTISHLLSITLNRGLSFWKLLLRTCDQANPTFLPLWMDKILCQVCNLCL